MNTKTNAAILVAAVALAACTTMESLSNKMSGKSSSGEHVLLTGANEVPPVQTGAKGDASVTVAEDRSVKVDLRVVGMTPTAAHIHLGAAGANGPVIVPLEKKGDHEFVTKDGARLTDDQYQAYKSGRTYVNVHSAEHKAGEIRAQLKGH
jgi:hypothetical protein